MARDPDIHAKWSVFRAILHDRRNRDLPAGVISINDRLAVDLIADMLMDPDWGVGMLEDIAEIISATGRDLSNPDEVPTWDRH